MSALVTNTGLAKSSFRFFSVRSYRKIPNFWPTNNLNDLPQFVSSHELFLFLVCNFYNCRALEKKCFHERLIYRCPRFQPRLFLSLTASILVSGYSKYCPIFLTIPRGCTFLIAAFGRVLASLFCRIYLTHQCTVSWLHMVGL